MLLLFAVAASFKVVSFKVKLVGGLIFLPLNAIAAGLFPRVDEPVDVAALSLPQMPAVGRMKSAAASSQKPHL